MRTIYYPMEGKSEPIEFRFVGPDYLVKEVFIENRILSHGPLPGDEGATQDALLQAAVYSPSGMQLKDLTCDSIEDVMDQLVGYANSMEAKNCVDTTIISKSEPHINERMAMRISEILAAFYSPYLR